tara:strand:+ start:7704 stop:9077 length:1374 start_codon:yes stop_codon:yes gene_type:complete
MKKPWSGRFKESTDKLMERFNASIGFDWRLYAFDIEGSLAHCKMLAKCGIIKTSDSKLIAKGLDIIKKEIESGNFVFDDSLEDIHMHVEARLIELIGPIGGKLHTGRSRNDQVCLDVRLYMRSELDEIEGFIIKLQKTLLNLAKGSIDHIIPGYTHLQRAQPVPLAHHLLAYLEMIERDRERLAETRKRVNILPLGSAAIAGTNFPIDRNYVAKLLNFPKISNNSMDAVADRDFIVEFCSASSILMMHLSRFCEELVLWSSTEFGFVQLSDAFATGSSIMPQKKNPDAAELIRGKTGRVYGNLVTLLSLMKALPLAYNKDLQEDKEPLFDTVDTIKISLEVLEGMLKTAAFRKIPLEELRSEGFLTATDLADYLVLQGTPFREAHEITGKTVAYCLDQEKNLEELTHKELTDLSKKFKSDVFKYVSLEKSVDRKNIYGGASRKRVKDQLKRWSRILQ